ncbi:hypothetical protein FGB62_64g145 [Gracilaria domingensis]|nr:hypothetical protein FGB62_64g145 [Gracilaria domingensis]
MAAAAIEGDVSGVHAKKDASHGAFYSGFVKGMVAAVDGIKLFATSDSLRKQFWQLMKPIRNAQIVYASSGVLLFLLLRDPADDITELFWTISRWGRIVTVLTSIILEYQYGATSAMFFAALKERDPEFGAAVENRPKTKKSFREKLSGLKRAAKLTMFKLAGAIVQKVFPGGTGIAAAVSAVHAIPAEILETSRVDDVLVSFGEAVVDADEAGEESVADYTKRLESVEMRTYFFKRYRGYIAGCGFVYSLLSAVPFLGIPLTLISECGAACLVTEIVHRNLDKEFRKPLTCEESLQNKKES